MVLLNAKDKQILHDGINKQFDIWQKSDSNIYINTTRHKLLNLVDKKTFPEFWELDSEAQWDFACALCCLYQSNTVKKSKSYNNSDIAKVNKKITGDSIETTIKNLNIDSWGVSDIN